MSRRGRSSGPGMGFQSLLVNRSRFNVLEMTNWAFFFSDELTCWYQHPIAEVCISNRDHQITVACMKSLFRGVLQSGCVDVWRQGPVRHSFVNTNLYKHMGSSFGRRLFHRSLINVLHQARFVDVDDVSFKEVFS